MYLPTPKYRQCSFINEIFIHLLSKNKPEPSWDSLTAWVVAAKLLTGMMPDQMKSQPVVLGMFQMILKAVFMFVPFFPVCQR